MSGEADVQLAMAKVEEAAGEVAERMLEGAVSPVDELLRQACVGRAVAEGGTLGEALASEERAEVEITKLMEWARGLIASGFVKGALAGAMATERELRTPAGKLGARAEAYGCETVPDDAATYSGRSVREMLRVAFVLGWNAHQEGDNRGRMPPQRRRR